MSVRRKSNWYIYLIALVASFVLLGLFAGADLTVQSPGRNGSGVSNGIVFPKRIWYHGHGNSGFAMRGSHEID